MAKNYSVLWLIFIVYKNILIKKPKETAIKLHNEVIIILYEKLPNKQGSDELFKWKFKKSSFKSVAMRFMLTVY